MMASTSTHPPLVPHVWSIVSGNGLLPDRQQTISPIPEPMLTYWFCFYYGPVLCISWIVQQIKICLNWILYKVHCYLIDLFITMHKIWIELNWNWKKINWIGIGLKDSEYDLNLYWIELKNPESNLNWNWIELKKMNWSEPCGHMQ